MRAWRRVLETLGVDIREHCELRDLVVERGLARRLVTSQGDLRPDQVVIAAGAATARLHRLLRTPLPIQPGKGYSLTMRRPALCPRHSMIFEEHRVAVTPLQSAYRIGSTMEFAGFDTSLNPDRLRLLREALRSTCGNRPPSPSSNPGMAGGR